MRRFVVALSLVAMLPASAMIAPPARACSCADGPPPPGLVFTGRVIAVVDGHWPRWLGFARYHGDRSYAAVLMVEHMLEGPPVPIVLVRGGDNSAGCEYPFAVGGTYWVYGLRRGLLPLETNSCLDTHQVR